MNLQNYSFVGSNTKTYLKSSKTNTVFAQSEYTAMKTTPDYDLAPHIARGRQLRSQAFLSAYRVLRDWVKGAAAVTPKAATRAQNA